MTLYKINISKLFTKISFRILFAVALFVSASAFAQIDGNKKNILIPTRSKQDTINNKNKDNYAQKKRLDTLNIIPTDSLSVKKDSIHKKETLTDKITYSSDDYREVNMKKKYVKLYNNAHIHYEDIDLKAGVIYIDYKKKEVYAGRIKDSAGNYVQRPIFKQGKTESQNDSLRFNFETKKALVWNTITTEGEFTLHSDVTKKFNDSVLFVKNVRFTTSTDSVHPEYYFLAKKGKIVPGKKIVIGTTQMWIEEVATPLVIPFGFFPLTDKRTSGFILPSFADSQYGYSFAGGGFYWAMSPYADLKLTSDIYTNGSYNMRLDTRYKLRYKFNGTLSFSYFNRITSEIGLPDYQKSTEWHLNWRHSKDNKSSPLSSFSANVRLGSSKYYRNSLNYQDISNAANTLTNTMSSSITYNQRFARLPINYSLSLSHNQNTNTEVINFKLPHFNLNVSNIYPFSVNGKKNNIFQKIKLKYSFDAMNKITTNDEEFFTDKMWKGSQMGAKHHIPISTNAKIFNYINFSPKIDYKEVWQLFYYKQSWDPTLNNDNGGVKYEEIKDFKSYRDINLGASLSTSIYGTYLFGDKHKIMGLRHTLQTSLSYGYSPTYDDHVRTYEKPDGERVSYSIFDKGLYGSPRIKGNKSLMLNFSNSFELKVKTGDKKNKKIKILTVSSAYNFIADSLNLSPFSFSSTQEIFKGMSVNLRSTFDPYALDKDGKGTNEYALSKGQGLGRFKGFNLSTGYHFNNQTFGKKDEGNSKKNEYLGAYNNPFIWDMNLSYTFVYLNKAYAPNDDNFIEIPTHSLTFSGSIKFSDNWKVRYTSGYDLVGKGFGYSTFHFTRDLKSWRMQFTWIPSRHYWLFNIGIKSSMLQGIKYDKRRESFQQF